MILRTERTKKMGKEKYEPNEEDLKELMDTLGDIADGVLGPDAELPEGTKSLLGSAFELLDKENREFASGNVALNPDAFRVFRAVAILLKNMTAAGMGKVDIIEDAPSLLPSRLRFSTEGFVMYGDDLDKFASCVEQSTSFGIYPETDGNLRLDFGIANMWKKIDLETGGDAT